MQENKPTGKIVEVATEGAKLSARFFAPEGEVKAHLVLHGATGVPQGYYASFADWAAKQGIGVLTYDYRDFGASQIRPMRESKATFSDWAIRDQAAAEATLAELAPEGPLWMLGHSLGGMTFPFRKHDARMERITAVGAGFTNVSDHPWSYRPFVLAFWYGIGPLATMVAGYMPGKKLSMGADLPAGVYWQWRRWCISPDFYRGDIGVALPEPDFVMEGPQVRILTMEDDVVVPPSAVLRYVNAFPEGRVTYQKLHPYDFGLPSLRHIEVFSRRNSAVWPHILGPEGTRRTADTLSKNCNS